MPKDYMNIYIVLILFVPLNLFSQRGDKGTDKYFDLGYSDFIHKNYLSSVSNFELFILKEQNSDNPRNDKLHTVYSYKADCYKKTGNYSKAIESYRKSLYYAELCGDKSRVALTLNRLGELYYVKGEHNKSLEFYAKALRYFKETNWERYIIESHITIGDIYLLKQNFTIALNHFNLALEMEVTKDIEAPILIPSIYNRIGKTKFAKKDYAGAVKSLGKALDFNRDSKKYEPERIIEIAESYSLIGDVLQNTVNHIATIYYDSALSIYKSVNNKDMEALILKKKGDYLKCIGKFDSAMQYYQEGLAVKTDPAHKLLNLSNPDSEIIEPGLTVFKLLNAKADLLSEMYKQTRSVDYLKSSYQTYLLALDIFSRYENLILNRETKLYFNRIIKSVYSHALQVAYSLYVGTGDKEFLISALELSDRSRSALLVWQLNELYAKGYARIPDSLLTAEKKLLSRIDEYKRLIYTEKINNEQKDNREDSLFVLNRKHEQIISDIEKQYPAYAIIKYQNELLNIDSIQNKLNKETGIIEYHLFGNSLFAFVLSKEKLDVVKVNIDSSFYENVNILTNLLKKKKRISSTGENINAFLNASAGLYSKLFKPIDTLIVNYGKLVIVPDGILGYIPFDILLTNIPSDFSAFNDFPYLLKSKTISYAFSAALYNTFIKKHCDTYSENRVLAMAPFARKQEIATEDDLMAELRTRGIEDLALLGTEKEVEDIADYYNCNFLLSENATKQDFIEQAPGYRILHIATHGIIDEENPSFSKLLFYRNKNDTPDDGALYEYELYNMRLNADLAILSACNTGTGKLQQGEGVLSFARGFFYAGVPAVVMTQWSVDDNSGAELMMSFYKYLKDGLDKDEALRMAKLGFLKQTDNPLKYDPYFWAGYIIVGDTSKIDESDNKEHYLLLPVSIGVILILAAGFLKLRFV